MGQQQLLLLVLAAVIVGLAVVTGINMFGANAAQANEDAIRNDLVSFGGEAQGWFRRPVALGGGGYTFTDLVADAGWAAINHGNVEPFVNANASYEWGAPALTPPSQTIVATSLLDHDGDGDTMILTATITANTVTVAVTQAD